MVAHLLRRHHAKRQTPDPFSPPPNVSGIQTAAITQNANAATATGLAVDTTATGAPALTGVPLVSGSIPVITSTLDTTPTSSPSTTPSAASNSSSPIPMSTVVGSCVGALVGAIALIGFGLWMYGRYTKSIKARSRSRGFSQSRNARAERDRERVRSEPWNKLEDGDDKWEGMYQTKEADNVAPMEKLTMFKKTPSVRTAYTHKSDEPIGFDPHPFAMYHPKLAEELASQNTTDVTEMPVPRPFLGRVETGNAMSWDGESLGKSSFLSLHSTRLSGGAMSPTLSMAIPTPTATTSEPHRWESAEIVNFDEGQTPEIITGPSVNEKTALKRRSSHSNPFFNAQEAAALPRSRSNSTTQPPTKSNKGKERAIDIDIREENPFSDANNISVPKPFATHTAQASVSSISSNERAIQSLIAALDVSEAEVQERLRVASMQPSILSTTSVYTDGEEDVTREFPLPPSNIRND